MCVVFLSNKSALKDLKLTINLMEEYNKPVVMFPYTKGTASFLYNSFIQLLISILKNKTATLFRNRTVTQDKVPLTLSVAHAASSP